MRPDLKTRPVPAWGGPIKADRLLRWGDFEVLFELVGEAITESGVPAVEVEVGVEAVGDFEAGFFGGGKGGTRGQQFGFEGAPTGFGLGVVGAAVAGQGPGIGDALAAGRAGILAAPVSRCISSLCHRAVSHIGHIPFWFLAVSRR